MAAVKCYVRKNPFFLVEAAYRNDPSSPTALLAGFSTMKGYPVLFSVFQSHNCWPNKQYYGVFQECYPVFHNTF